MIRLLAIDAQVVVVVVGIKAIRDAPQSLLTISRRDHAKGVSRGECCENERSGVLFFFADWLDDVRESRRA